MYMYVCLLTLVFVQDNSLAVAAQMMTVSSPSPVAKEDINVPQVSSGDKSGKLMLKKGKREREREREREIGITGM